MGTGVALVPWAPNKHGIPANRSLIAPFEEDLNSPNGEAALLFQGENQERTKSIDVHAKLHGSLTVKAFRQTGADMHQ